MRKRRWLKIGICFTLILMFGGFYKFFSDYASLNEEIRLRTAYYIKTGQVLNIVRKEYLEGSKIESSNTNVAEITNDGGIMAKNPGRTNITVTKESTTNQATPPQLDSTPTDPTQGPSMEVEEDDDIENFNIEYNFDVVVQEPVQGVY